MRLILCGGIRPSMGTENLIPEEVNYTKIGIRVAVMDKVQFLPASEPGKTFEAAIPLRDIACRKRRARKTTPRLRLPSPQKDLTAIRNKRILRR
jgi:hypothetical protein